MNQFLVTSKELKLKCSCAEEIKHPCLRKQFEPFSQSRGLELALITMSDVKCERTKTLTPFVEILTPFKKRWWCPHQLITQLEYETQMLKMKVRENQQRAEDDEDNQIQTYSTLYSQEQAIEEFAEEQRKQLMKDFRSLNYYSPIIETKRFPLMEINQELEQKIGGVSLYNEKNRYFPYQDIKARKYESRLPQLVLRGDRMALTLDFEGKIHQNSDKNFQLILKDPKRRACKMLNNCSRDGEYTALISGKICPKEYLVDYRFPLSTLQAYSSVIVMHLWNRIKKNERRSR